MSALHELLVRTAARVPDHPLFVGSSDGDAVSYGDADRATAAVAGGLREAGVARGDRVALLLPDRPEWLIAYYGILRAGAAVVPLSPDARAGSLTNLLLRCGARAVITGGKNSKLLVGQLERLIELRLLVCHGPSQLEPASNLRVVSWQEVLGAAPYTDEGVGEDDLASVMFTSGTTAAPKGVMSSHRNHVAATRSIVGYLDLRPDERLAMVLPFFYSYGISVLHTHVAVGGTVCLVGSVAFPAAVLRGIQQHRCTGLSGVPSTFARLVRSKVVDTLDCSSLRYLTQAGGPMSPALTREVLRAFPSAAARLYVMYGQTEATPRLSYLSPADLPRKLGSVGKAIPGVTLRVLDAEGNPCPPGVEGELVATGPNIMQGYWNDPEATSRTLGPEGLRTGDLARVDEEGFLYIVGRRSDMIKAGGYRVGPQEIEAVIEKMEQVAQCGVVGVPDALDGEAIAAYVRPAPGVVLDEKMVLAACLRELPRFKMPAHVRIVDQLPCTDSGKLRRVVLREWFAREQQR